MTELATIDFHGDRLFAFEREGEQFVAMRPIVEALGLDWSAQYRRIERDEVLSSSVAIMATVTDAGERQAVCLPLHLLNGWLFGIDASRVKEELRERITLYRRECFHVLAEHFGAARLPAPPADHDQLTMQEKRQLVNEARVTFDRRSARELWLALGLPTTESMRRCGSAVVTEAPDYGDRILSLIRHNPGIARRDIQRTFQQLRAAQLDPIIDNLREQGLIHLTVRRPRHGGRPAATYTATNTLN